MNALQFRMGNKRYIFWSIPLIYLFFSGHSRIMNLFPSC